MLMALLVSFAQTTDSLELEKDSLNRELLGYYNQVGELEKQGAALQLPNAIEFEEEHIGVFTAYSCESTTGELTEAELLMNCPSKIKHPEGRTATGTVPTVGRTLACPARLTGKSIYIPRMDKTYVCEDTGGAIVGDKLDMYVEDIQEARQFGVKKLIYKVL